MKLLILIFCFSFFLLEAKQWKEVNFTKLDQLLDQYISNHTFPGILNKIYFTTGAVIGIYQKDFDLPHFRNYGKFEYPGDVFPADVKIDTIYDIASLSKVVGATTAAMILWERGYQNINNNLSGLLDIDANVIQYLPEFSANNKDSITIRNLLLHNSGLPADAPLFDTYWTRQRVVEWIYNCHLEYPTGSKTVYSDLSMVTLQLIIERITNQGLDQFLYQNVFGPLKMHTQFNPPLNMREQITPTQNDTIIRHELIWGVVHDPTAFDMGGVSGNAGLFSNAPDLMKFMLMMIDQSPVKLVRKETLHYWTQVVKQIIDKIKQQANISSYKNSRALGWDTVPIQEFPPCGNKVSPNSFGHTGFTGTSAWADWDKEFILVMLTNRVYPNNGGKEILKFRTQASDLILDLLGY